APARARPAERADPRGVDEDSRGGRGRRPRRARAPAGPDPPDLGRESPGDAAAGHGIPRAAAGSERGSPEAVAGPRDLGIGGRDGRCRRDAGGVVPGALTWYERPGRPPMIPRYSRPELARLWEDKYRFELWLEIELAACTAMEK